MLHGVILRDVVWYDRCNIIFGNVVSCYVILCYVLSCNRI